jgi:hypothetical protein
VNAELVSAWLLPVHALATAAMFGVIWLVQLAHYPLMLSVGPERFHEWHKGHLARITFVVGPLMLLETATGLAWILLPDPANSPLLAWVGMGLIFAIWLSTAILQVPLHRKLELGGYDASVIRRLVATNWLRTLAWSARAVLVLLALIELR